MYALVDLFIVEMKRDEGILTLSFRQDAHDAIMSHKIVQKEEYFNCHERRKNNMY